MVYLWVLKWTNLTIKAVSSDRCPNPFLWDWFIAYKGLNDKSREAKHLHIKLKKMLMQHKRKHICSVVRHIRSLLFNNDGDCGPGQSFMVLTWQHDSCRNDIQAAIGMGVMTSNTVCSLLYHQWTLLNILLLAVFCAKFWAIIFLPWLRLKAVCAILLSGKYWMVPIQLPLLHPVAAVIYNSAAAYCLCRSWRLTWLLPSPQEFIFPRGAFYI